MDTQSNEWIIEWCLDRKEKYGSESSLAKEAADSQVSWCSPCTTPGRASEPWSSGVSSPGDGVGRNTNDRLGNDAHPQRRCLLLPRLVESPEKAEKRPASADKRRRCFVTESPRSGSAQRRRQLWLSASHSFEGRVSLDALQAELEAAARRREEKQRYRQERVRQHWKRVLLKAAEARTALAERYRHQWLAKERAMEAAAVKRERERVRNARRVRNASRALHRRLAIVPVDGSPSQCRVQGRYPETDDAVQTDTSSEELAERASPHPDSASATYLESASAYPISEQRISPELRGSQANATRKSRESANQNESAEESCSRPEPPARQATHAVPCQELEIAAAACCYLHRAGFPLRAGISFEEATREHLQVPACIQHADQLLKALTGWIQAQERALIAMDAANSAAPSECRLHSRGDGRVFLASFLVHRFPEYALGDQTAEHLCAFARNLVDRFAQLAAAAATKPRTDNQFERNIAGFVQSWRCWKRAFIAWKRRDAAQLLEGLAHELAALDKLRGTVRSATTHQSATVANQTIGYWEREVNQLQDRLHEMTRLVGGVQAERYVQRLATRLVSAAPETEPGALTAELDAVSGLVRDTNQVAAAGLDVNTVLAHEILVDLPSFRERVQSSCAAAWPIPSALSRRIHCCLRKAYFDRFREALVCEAYVTLFVDAVRDLREVLRQLLPPPPPSKTPQSSSLSARREDDFPAEDPQRQRRTLYAAEVERMHDVIDRELDPSYWRQRLEALIEAENSTTSTSNQTLLRQVALESLAHIIFIAVQVLFLVQMPAKDASLVQAWAPAADRAAGVTGEKAVLRPPTRHAVAKALQERINQHSLIEDAIVHVWEELFDLIEDRQRDLRIARIERMIPLVQQFGPAREYAVMMNKFPGLPRSRQWLATFGASAGIQSGSEGAKMPAPRIDAESATAGTRPLLNPHRRAQRDLMTTLGFTLQRVLIWTFTHPEAESLLSPEQIPEMLLLDRDRLLSWRNAGRCLVEKAAMLLRTRHCVYTGANLGAQPDEVWSALHAAIKASGHGLNTSNVAERILDAIECTLVSLDLDVAARTEIIRRLRAAQVEADALDTLLERRLAELLSARQVRELPATYRVFGTWHEELRHFHSQIQHLGMHLAHTYAPILEVIWPETVSQVASTETPQAASEYE